MRRFRPVTIAILMLAVCVAVFAGTVMLRLEMSPEHEMVVVDRLLQITGDVPPFNWLLEGVASASRIPIVEVSYDANQGRGYALNRRPDGTALRVNFSLFDDFGSDPHGLLIGGATKGLPEEASGVSYFNGTQWIHLWCSANEGIAAAQGGEVMESYKWAYLDSGIEKLTLGDTTLWSEHKVDVMGQPLEIRREAELKADSDYLVLKVTVKNTGDHAVIYDYAYGDEPWVGRFGDAGGDIGWYSGGLVKREAYLPTGSTFGGFWDSGNDEAGEHGTFSRYANFIEWNPEPTMVYFSNDFYSVDPEKPLSDSENRILNIVWKDQWLDPGHTRTYTFAIGMAGVKPDSVMPAKPLVASMDSGGMSLGMNDIP